MARLPTQKKILREDLKEAPAWIDKLIFPINSFFETIYNALSRNITLAENIGCQIKGLEFNTLAGYDGTCDAEPVTTYAKWAPISFPKTVKFRANGVLLLQIVDLGVIGALKTSYRPIAGDVANGGVYLDWQEGNEEIVIGLIRGLTAGHTYRARFLVI